MIQEIEAVFLDLGNTLRILTKNDDHQSRARQRIVELVGVDEDPAAFCEKLDQRYKIYRKWAFETMREAPESELWTRWLAYDFPAERIGPLGTELTYQYRQSMGLRVVVEHGKEVVQTLFDRGYTLGIISNLITTSEIPEWMEADGFTPYFKSVALSSVLGIRKPDPAIYHIAAQNAGVDPSRCAYVGDNLKRDVTGTRAAGFGMTIILISPEELAEATITEVNRPDLVIHQFTDLLEIFPSCPKVIFDERFQAHKSGSLLEESAMNTSEDKHGGILLGEAVKKAYSRGQTDYSMEPLVRLNPNGNPVGKIQDGDAVIFCCRRGEREIELTEAFTETDFAHFEREQLKDLEFVILTLYHDKFKDLPVAFAPAKLNHTLGEVLSKAGKSQLRCSESEKFAHITFFLNGGNNQPYPGEVDIRIPSPKGIPFDQVPELSLPAVADEVIRGLKQGIDCIVTNFANGDVIGHTSNSEAKIACAQVVDKHLDRVVQVAQSEGYVTLITADHGNLEVLLTAKGKPHVSHTSNPVPFILIDPDGKDEIELSDGSLRDIAPTILNILGVEKHPCMTGTPLMKPRDWGKDRKVLLIILDGWGEGSQDENNPIYVAATPTWDALCRDFPMAHLQASGEAVGLQAGKPGNSEAGHMNIGAGRTVLQDDVRLDMALKDGSFAKNEVFVEAIENVLRKGTNLHLIGLLTEKSSHGSIDYPLALLRMAKEKGLSDVFLHLIFDGRSTEPGSAPALLENLEGEMREIGIGSIVTAVGRGIALDRDGNYAKIKKAYEAMVLGQGTPW